MASWRLAGETLEIGDRIVLTEDLTLKVKDAHSKVRFRVGLEARITALNEKSITLLFPGCRPYNVRRFSGEKV